MQFKSIGELIKAFKTFDGAKVTSLLKNSGSLESAAKMLDLANVKTDKFMLLKDAFKDAKDDAINAALGISKVGDASTESTSKVKSLGSAIVGAFKTHPFLIVGTAIASIGTIAYTVYKNIKQGYIETATEATSVWDESKKSLEDYASKYQELKSQLESGNLSEAETISIKQQILDIQNQIVSAYGESAAGIDLINGKLDTQLAKIQSISREESKRNINENLNSYKDAEYEMTKSRTYSLGLIDGTEASDEINKIVKSFKDKGIYSNSNGLVTEIKFTGDTTQASEVINEFESQIRDLQKEFGEDNSLINSVLDWSSDALKDNKEKVLDVYQNNYKSYLEQQLYSDGYGQYLVDYAKSIDEYNTALLSGDTSKIQESKQAFEEANEAKNEFLSGDGKEKFGFLFDEIIQSLDLSTIKLIDFKEAMDSASDGNQFKDSEKSLQKFSKQLQKLSLNRVDIEDAFFTDGFQKGEIAARRLGEVWGITTDSSKEDVMSFIDVLVELGLITDSVTGATNELASAIDEVKNRESLYNQIDNNINSNKRFDAITAADETRNAGDDYVSADKYLDEAKEMYDKGLIGTDDFKARAAYFSPTGSDDPANFIENYRKTSRYLTEDATGVQAFLKDLAKKTNEAGEAMASYNKETGKWTYSIDDIEIAAQKMGMGTEFMLDMFGRLEDYGFSNNFASSVEEASDKIIKKATELAKAKATLAEMETTGQYTTIDENGNEVKTVANQTAITAQREEIALLENDLLELQNLKTQLAAKDAQDYAEQIQIAKETYNSLAEERKRILEENTYGEDTKTVAALMEAEMKQIAQDNQLTIDAELNLVNPDEIQNEVNDLTIPANVQLIVDDESDIERLGGYLSKLSDTYSPKIIVDIENEEQIDQVASQLASIPTDTDANLTFNVQNQEEADSLSSKIENLKNESGATFTYSVNVVGDTQSVNDVSTDKESVIDVITKGTEDVKKLNDEIAKVEDKTSNIFAITTGYKNVVNLVNKINELPSKKTSVLEVIEKRTTSKDSEASGTLISPSHASGTAYNVLNYRHAYANGKVSLSKDETALVNEMGTESIIRNGEWFLIPGGMHMQALKKGDIILSASQTKNLLQTGRASGKGKAYADGTVGNIRDLVRTSLSAYAGGSGGGTFGVGGSGSKSGVTKSTDNNTKAVNKNTDAQNANTNAIQERKDFLEIKLERISHQLDEYKNLAENYYSALSAQNKMLDAAINQSKSNIKANEQAYATYMMKANEVGLSEDYKNRIINGEVNIHDITDENLKKQIDDFTEFYEKAQACRDTIIDLKTQIIELSKQKIDNVIDDYETFLSVADSVYGRYEAENKLFEAMGKPLLQDNLNGMISARNAQISYGRGELQELLNLEKSLLQSGDIKKWSQEWYDLRAKINDVTASIYEAEAEVYELRQQLREIRWEPFRKAIEDIDATNDNLENTLSLISDLEAFGKDSDTLNMNGKLQLGLLTKQLGNARQAVAEYENAFKALDNELANGNITQEQYDEQLKELNEGRWEAVSSVKKYRDVILSLVKDGINKETEAMQKLVDARKKDLQAQKDAANYARTLRDKTAEINKIKAQIAALQGDDSATAKAQLRNLQNQLKEKEQDLQDTQDDHAFDVLQDGYDNAMEKFEEIQENELYLLNSSLEAQNEAIANMLMIARDNYQEIYDELNEIAEVYGMKLSADIVNPWTSATEAVNAYKQAVGDVSSNTTIDTSPINGVSGNTDYVRYEENNNSAPDNNVTQQQQQQSSAVSGKVSEVPEVLQYGSQGNSVKLLQTALNSLGYNCGEVDGSFGDQTLAAVKRFQLDVGMAGDGVVGDNTKAHFRARGYLKGSPSTKKGLAKFDELGLGSEVIITDKGVLRQFNAGEIVFNAEQAKYLYDTSKYAVKNNFPTAQMPLYNPEMLQRDYGVHFDCLVNVEGNVTEDVMPMLERMVDNKIKMFDKETRRKISNNYLNAGGRMY